MAHPTETPSPSQDPVSSRIAFGQCYRACGQDAFLTPIEQMIAYHLLFQGWHATFPEQRPIPVSLIGLDHLTGFRYVKPDLPHTFEDMIRRRIIGVAANLYYVNRNYREWADRDGNPLVIGPRVRFVETGSP